MQEEDCLLFCCLVEGGELSKESVGTSPAFPRSRKYDSLLKIWPIPSHPTQLEELDPLAGIKSSFLTLLGPGESPGSFFLWCWRPMWPSRCRHYINISTMARLLWTGFWFPVYPYYFDHMLAKHLSHIISFAFLRLFLFTYLRESVQMHTCTHVHARRRRGRGRGRRRESQALHWEWSPTRGLISNPEIMTWAETRSHMLNWLSHPGAPTLSLLFLTLVIAEVAVLTWYRIKLLEGFSHFLRCIHSVIELGYEHNALTPEPHYPPLGFDTPSANPDHGTWFLCSLSLGLRSCSVELWQNLCWTSLI